MDTIVFNKNRQYGNFKILNATNGGPWHKRYCNDQWRSNFEDYKALNIPFSRNHDSNLSGSTYGGPFCHDVSVIFPDFSADVNDPSSYDFACTDESVLTTLDAGTQTFYRLGQSIEHQIKKHDTLPPKDFHKWAQICEHIIRHYNEGWADGYHLNMKYWEIWNEPDLCPDNSEFRRLRTWGGTKEQFFDFFEIASKHLKSCFPDLKIGGPAVAGDWDWINDFLFQMNKRNVRLDFFSWHIYCKEPSEMIEASERVKNLLMKYGYENSESILNEWNYVRGWTEDFKYTIRQITGMKGAAFTMACMSLAQESTIDMLMYYDTRPSCFCGLFDYYSYDPLKTYYSFKWFSELYRNCREIRPENKADSIYTLSGVKDNGKVLSVITYFSEDDYAADKEIHFDFQEASKYNIYLLDGTHDGELIDTTDDLSFTMKANTCLKIEEI